MAAPTKSTVSSKKRARPETVPPQAQKLIDQMAVGGLQFDTIKPCSHRVLGCLNECVDEGGNFRRFKCTRDLGVERIKGRRIHPSRVANGRGPNWQRSIRVVDGEGASTVVLDLHQDLPTDFMHLVRDNPPSCDLLGRIDAWG